MSVEFTQSKFKYYSGFIELSILPPRRLSFSGQVPDGLSADRHHLNTGVCTYPFTLNWPFLRSHFHAGGELQLVRFVTLGTASVPLPTVAMGVLMGFQLDYLEKSSTGYKVSTRCIRVE